METLEKNLRAMAGWTAAAAERVRGAGVPRGFERVVGTDGAATFVRVHGGEGGAEGGAKRLEWLGGTSMPEAAAGGIVASLEVGGGNGLGLSLGSGHGWKAFVRRLGGHQAVFVWEPEAGLARMALEVCDLSEELGSGRLVLVVGGAEEAGGALCGFLREHVGYEVPGVLHPLATVVGERRHGLVAAGEGMVRRAMGERAALVEGLFETQNSKLQTQHVGTGAGCGERGVWEVRVRERYWGERGAIGIQSGEFGIQNEGGAKEERRATEDQRGGCLKAGLQTGGVCPDGGRTVFFVDRWEGCSGALRVKVWAEEGAPSKVLSDVFRGQAGWLPEGVGVETWVPAGVGAGFWERVPGAELMAAGDRVVVRSAHHAKLFLEKGYGAERVAVVPLEQAEVTGGRRGEWVAVVGDLGVTSAEGLGVVLPTHQAVFAEARKLVEEGWSTVHDGQVGDLLRRALGRARVPAGALEDPALGEPMRKLVRHVLVPMVPMMELVKVLRSGGVKVKLIGDWPEVEAGAGVVKVGFPRDEAEMERVWEGVGALVHFSPTGVVLPVEAEGARRGVSVVVVEHVTNGMRGAVGEVLRGVGRVGAKGVGARVKGLVIGNW